jgi:hypothetical protein
VSGAGNLTVSAGGPPAASSAQLALTSTVGYLLAPDGEVYSGPIAGGAWHPAPSLGTPVAGCLPGLPQRNGVPSGAMLATTGPGIVELCTSPGPGGTQIKNLRYSTDGGNTWQPAGTAPSAGTATSLAGTPAPAGYVVVATSVGIDVSTTAPEVRPGVLRWRAVQVTPVPGGFSYVGMTSSTQGVAIPADEGLHAVWFTYDGGRQWLESLVRSPAS